MIDSEPRDWKGILISLLVIFLICGLIGATILILRPRECRPLPVSLLRDRSDVSRFRTLVPAFAWAEEEVVRKGDAEHGDVYRACQSSFL